MSGKIPLGCYPTEEWTIKAILPDGLKVVEHCTQYVRATDNEIMGTLVYTFSGDNGDELIGSEFIAWEA
jgi:hypothetical protein